MPGSSRRISPEIASQIKKWLIRVVAVFFALAALVALIVLAAFIIYQKKYESRIYPNIYLGDIELGGKTVDEADRLIAQRIEKISQEGFAFSHNGKTSKVYPSMESMSADLAFDIITFNTKDTLEKAYDLGRNGSYLKNSRSLINIMLNRQVLEMRSTVVDEKVVEQIYTDFPPSFTDAKNAEFRIKDGKAEVIEEQNGISINYKSALADLKRKLLILDNAPIALDVQTTFPEVKKEDFMAENVESTAQEIIDYAPVELSSGSKKWTIDSKTLSGWITVKKELDFCASGTISDILSKSGFASATPELIEFTCNSFKAGERKMLVGLDKNPIKTYIEKKIAPDLDVEAAESKFQIKNGKVVAFQGNKDGRKIDPEKNYLLIEYAIITRSGNKIKLAADVVKAEVSVDEINDKGIKEIIGTGKSSFAGSPSNRRTNIRVGASRLHGILIKPGEEFSLIKTLGSIDASNGYLPELVIKDNKTIPEYGGGLCQIGTTMFRAALASGLPITARTNHSYRVSYYEPAGTDATIYDPWPDFRFKNDTGKYILIQMRLSGSNLAFDFWGTKDGRKAHQTYPTIYNIVKPKPTKIVETTDLKPGAKKCTESAHNGADAYFDYTVTYPSGDVKKKRFSSHYRPWQAVCLLGVEKISTPAAEKKEEPKTTTPPTAEKPKEEPTKPPADPVSSTTPATQ